MIREIRRDEIAHCVDLIRQSFLTVAREYGITEENAPRFTAFAVNCERLNRQYDEGRPMYAYYDGIGRMAGYYSLYLEKKAEERSGGREQEDGLQKQGAIEAPQEEALQKQGAIEAPQENGLQKQDWMECELNNLCVLPEYRGARIGESLFRHALATAAGLGCRKMKIGIVEENRPLRLWYERLGAKHVGTKKFDFFPFTCGYMERDVREEGEQVKTGHP